MDLRPYLKASNSLVQTDVFTADGTWVAPVGVYKVYVEAWGGGGSGGRKTSTNGGAGGGAGGSYAASSISVIPGASYPVVVGAGGVSTTSLSNPGGNSTFNSSVVVAEGGQAGGGNASPVGATGSIASSVGTVKYAGGNGGNGGGGGTPGGGGGEGASPTANGNAGVAGSGGGAGGSGGAGGDGGAGRNTTGGAGTPGSVIGGAGGGAFYAGSPFAGGNGARGEVRVTYSIAGGSAGLVHVTANRSVGSSTLVVDATELAASNLPDKLIGTTGTVAANGFIDPATKTEMALTKASSTQYTIDAFLPGSTDIGNFENQVLIVRSSTHFANTISEFMEDANGFGTPQNWYVNNLDVDNLTGDSLELSEVTLLDGVTNPTYRYTVSSGAYAGDGTQVTFPHGLAFTPRVRARYSSSFYPDVFIPLPETIVSAAAYGDPPSLKVNIQAVDATNITVGIAIQDSIGLSTMLSRHNLLFQFYCDRFPGT